MPDFIAAEVQIRRIGTKTDRFIDPLIDFSDRIRIARTDFIDDLHTTFGFRTDYQIVSKAEMKKILKATKK